MEPVNSSGMQTVPAVFFDSVARHILAQHAHEIPDLRRTLVLLPNYHVAQPLAQALAKAANRPALLLPHMVTLNDWAQSVPLAASVVPDTCRATALYQALRARRWFADADLWGIASELLGLLDELTQHHVTLPQDEEDFLEQLERAYQAKRNAAMQFEARVVHELWYAMSISGELDAARAYQQRLAQTCAVRRMRRWSCCWLPPLPHRKRAFWRLMRNMRRSRFLICARWWRKRRVARCCAACTRHHPTLPPAGGRRPPGYALATLSPQAGEGLGRGSFLCATSNSSARTFPHAALNRLRQARGAQA